MLITVVHVYRLSLPLYSELGIALSHSSSLNLGLDSKFNKALDVGQKAAAMWS